MNLEWIHEQNPSWDEDKERIIGGAPEGIFGEDITGEEIGDSAPGKWWRVEKEGEVVGYGWLDVTWGEAEILLAVAPEHQGNGIGSFIMEHLKDEAADSGVNYVYNVVPESHPEKETLRKWLKSRGFNSTEEDKKLLKASVSS